MVDIVRLAIDASVLGDPRASKALDERAALFASPKPSP
jgi:hypothetical protein